MQNTRKRRKRRVNSIDLCSCGHFRCDHMMSQDSPAHRKIQKRLDECLCMGCGKKKCQCKRTGSADWSIATAREKELISKR
jgi:hypothetical protein